MAGTLDPQRLHQHRLAVAEAMGATFEPFGLPRAAGRILGWLTVCDPAEQSAADIGGALHLAPSTVSTMARTLLQAGFIERVPMPGDRKRFLRARPHGWLEAMYAEADAWRRLETPVGVLRDYLADHPGIARERLDEFHDFIGFFDREIPALIDRFLAERRSKNNEES
ncbi:MAG: MarR family transcriptional regulator [Deltaproteobacteria bacterium]|nr:MarR family transcriptional regulator [Deltaproteobacteria bacterium]